MYQVPHEIKGTSFQQPFSHMHFILKSSLIIACISGFISTLWFAIRYQDYDIAMIVIFIAITVYCFILGFLLSSFINSITFVLLSRLKRPIPLFRRMLVPMMVAVIGIAITAYVTLETPSPGEEPMSLQRYVGRVIVPCVLHFVAIMWHNYRINRAVRVDPATQDIVLTPETK